MDLQTAKDFLHIDTNYEDLIIQGLIDAAKLYIEEAVGIYDENNKVMEYCALQLVAWWYNNRGESGSNTDVPFIVKTMLQHCCFVHAPAPDEIPTESEDEPESESEGEEETPPENPPELPPENPPEEENSGENEGG